MWINTHVQTCLFQCHLLSSWEKRKPPNSPQPDRRMTEETWVTSKDAALCSHWNGVTWELYMTMEHTDNAEWKRSSQNGWGHLAAVLKNAAVMGRKKQAQVQSDSLRVFFTLVHITKIFYQEQLLLVLLKKNAYKTLQRKVHFSPPS